MYEHRTHKPLTPALFRRRVVLHSSVVLAMITASLFIGMIGYHALSTPAMPWIDAFLNSAMLLGGMGPVDPSLTNDRVKLFAGFYAMYAGLAFIAAGGLLLAPFVHRLMHKLHWQDKG
jgi:hypothetical protein